MATGGAAETTNNAARQSACRTVRCLGCLFRRITEVYERGKPRLSGAHVQHFTRSKYWGIMWTLRLPRS